MALLDPFTEVQQWERWGQWIGVHACTTQDCIRVAAENGRSMPQTQDYTILASQFASMPLDGESVPRFFIVSDHQEEEDALQKEIWNLNLIGAKGAGVVFPVKYRRTQPQSVAGLRETVALLHLLSSSSLVIGTEGSALSEAAAAAGDVYLVLARVQQHQQRFNSFMATTQQQQQQQVEVEEATTTLTAKQRGRG